ncbi:MAG: type II secretion system F family protein [Terracidiphilus sp.]
MGLAIIAFLAVFLLISSGGFLLFHREGTMLKRISEAIAPKPKEKRLTSAMEKAKSSLGGLMESVENLIPKSEKEVSVLQQRLVRAGYRNESAVKIFYGSKVLLIGVLLLLVMVVSQLISLSWMFFLVAVGAGYLGPDFILGHKIKKRQGKITRGLPDVLDLLVICMEAGLSLDQATARTAEELAQPQPELCDELGMVVLEQRAGRARADAWKNMAERTDVDSVKNLVSIMVQTEQFGTSIAKMLRVHSESLRTQRVQMIEEMAAKTTVKLIFPLVLFIFPSLFVVTLGPAAIMIMESFSAMGK